MTENLDHHITADSRAKKAEESQSDRMPTPTLTPGRPMRKADFLSISDALDYAAEGDTGINFYSPRGDLEGVFPYSDVRKIARDQARHLLGLGLRRGDRVGIVADMSVNFVTLFFACQYAGLMAVPLPVVTGLGGRQGYETQLAQVLKTSGARVAIGPEDVLSSLGRATQDLDMALTGTVGDLAAGPDFEGALRPLAEDEDSHIQFSSGSTRNPLGILISQKALIANAQSVARHGLQFRDGDRVASWLPFYHDMGLIGFLLIPIATQMSIDFLQTDAFARRPLSWLRVISENKCTMAFSPTFGYEICARRAARKKGLDLDLSHWRVAGIGGDMVQPDALKIFSETFASFGFRKEAFVPSYGLAEMTLAFSFTPLETGVEIDCIDKQALIDERQAVPALNGQTMNGKAVNGTDNGHAGLNGHANGKDGDEAHTDVRKYAKCGLPLPGYHLEIRDEGGAVLGQRHVGHVFIKGPSLMAGYDRNPEATDHAIDEDGWLNTGDMGYICEDGKLVITGRHKDLVIINGRNIWPQDLEWHAEKEVEKISSRGTAAFAVENKKGREEAIILVQCRSQDKDVQDKIRQDVHAAIFRNIGVDCKVVLVSSGTLPFTTSGKLRRTQAKKSYLQGDIRDIGSGSLSASL